MKTYKNLYPKIYEWKNLVLAYKKARKGKSKMSYVIEFEEDLGKNLQQLQLELMSLSYKPRPLERFILRDPKTRVICKSDFRDRIIHHAICNIIEPIFEKLFIYDSCANQKGKGNLFALDRLYKFIRKVSKNGKINGWFNNNQIKGYCFKADIKHYFKEVNHETLIRILMKKIRDKKVGWLIRQILSNNQNSRERERLGQSDSKKGMPLGNLTSQFFANVYLNELDNFVKHRLKCKYYLRYVDDFIILHSSKKQLQIWKKEIFMFLKQNLDLELHPDKSRIILLSKGVDFVGFRCFYYFKLLRKRSTMQMYKKIELFREGIYTKEEIREVFQGWQAYAKWANSYKLRKKVFSKLGV